MTGDAKTTTPTQDNTGLVAADRTQTDPIRVLKFGGSSLATSELRELAARRVNEALHGGQQVVVVVSAMGRKPDAYATDSLLALAPDQAASGPNRDMLLACGEMISAAVFADMLTSMDIAARAFTGAQAGIITDAQHGNAQVISVDPRGIVEALEAGVVPVVCGYQGMTTDGSFSTLGRGGSDLTAVVLANALGNAALDIYTDVDGVMTADPKRVSSARTISALTFEEVTELSEHGATIMHDKAADAARVARMPYTVRSLRTNVATTIGERQATDSSHPVTGVATTFGFTFMHLVPDAAVVPGGWEHEAFRVLAENGISIDCVNVNSAGLFFIVRDGDSEHVQDLLKPLPLSARSRRNCAKISVVGAGMRGTPGVIFRCIAALRDANVPIIHSTDSNITISLLVPGAQAAAAERALHERFGLEGSTP